MNKTTSIPTLFAASVLALGAAGAASAQSASTSETGQGRALPPASTEHWTHHADTDVIDGAVAQINAKGEGRFAVMCEMGDRKGMIAYRTPAPARDEVRDGDGPITVTFTFDGGNELNRDLTWNAEGRYWVGPFGPNSRLAERMQKAYEVVINVKDHPGVRSEFTLDGSFDAIEKMFATCHGA